MRQTNESLACAYPTHLAAIAVLSLLAYSAGCTSEDQWTRNRPRRVPATGEVYFNGKPLAEAIVTFTNPEAGLAGSGTSDATGRFMLGTFDRSDGVVPGTQKVAVRRTGMDFPGTKLVGLTPSELKTAYDRLTEQEKLALPDPKERWDIPRRYGSPETSKLSVEVGEQGETQIRLELHD